MPRFRVRVSNGTDESLIEENFADEAAMRDRLARRGWTRILSVETGAAHDATNAAETAPGAAVDIAPPPVDLGPVRREGAWAYLTPEGARRHPLYGIGGWLITLAIYEILVLGVMLLAAGYALILAFEILDRLPALTVAVLMLSVAIIALRIGVLVLLFAESRWFPWAFLAVGALGILLGVMTVGDQPRPARTVGQMLTTAAWMIYVVVSRRVNLTFRKRINVREVPDGA